jgi:hypothetical protein
MGLIQQQLDRELSKEVKDTATISLLQGIIDKGFISLNEFRESGKFIPASDFVKDFPLENLHIDCTDVVKYFGDIYFQVLKTGYYLVDGGLTEAIVEYAEGLLYENNAGNFF